MNQQATVRQLGAAPGHTDKSSRAVTLHLPDDGPPVVHKQFDSSRGDTGLDEATWLAAANHPGVVRLVGRSEHPPTNVIEHVPGPTLRTAGLDAPAAATVLTAVTETLADLHQRSIFHGAVTPDHVIVSSAGDNGPVAVLCSPAIDNEALADAHGVGRCITWLLAEWQDRNIAVPNEWAALAERLMAEPPPDLRRAAHQLTSLGPGAASAAEPGSKQRPEWRPWTTLTKRLAVTAVVVVTAGVALALAAALAGMTFTQRPAASLDGARLQLSEGTFVVGSADDQVVALLAPCPGQPAALHLDVASGTVSTFQTIEDGATGTPMTVVPGATTLVTEGGEPCPRVWAQGPAGQVELDWP